ncbi:MAG: bifunctional folylpolyglutamate synthase/dihydrofolate synthase [Anaerolineae bacterium]
MSSYEEVIKRLYALGDSSYAGLGLGRLRVFLDEIGSPERCFPSIHIAGTNGKGSVAVKIAKALTLSGLKVGLYTSPHLESFCERIAIDGHHIAEKSVVQHISELLQISLRYGAPPTFFEMATLVCLTHFRSEKVDIAVIETGLGGRLDPTNLITPVLSVITSISFDHVHLLGDTLEKIAFEKAGIIKAGVPVVLGPRVLFQTIEKQIEMCQSPVFRVQHRGKFYDEENRAIAAAALNAISLHFPTSSDAKEKGLDTRPQCRFELFCGAILDVAHNPDGFLRLFEAIDYHFPNRPVRLVVGLCRDKEVAKCLEIAKRGSQFIHFVRSSHQKAMGVKELSVLSGDFPHAGHFEIKEGVKEAFKEARKERELLVVCGSFYLMEETKLALKAVAC